MAAAGGHDVRPICGADSTAQGGCPRYARIRRKAKALTWLFDHVELVDEDGKPAVQGRLAASTRQHSGTGDAGEVGDEDSADDGRARRTRERGRAG